MSAGPGKPGRYARPSPAYDAATEVFGDEVVVYCEDTQSLHCLDPRASVIWALCDGARDVEDIVRETAQVAGVEPAAVRGDVEATIGTFQELGLLRRGRL